MTRIIITILALCLLTLPAHSFLNKKDLKTPELKSVLSKLGLEELKWWQKGVVYQIYPKSFQDNNNDGYGDFEGVISKLDHLNDGTEKSLGIDAIWFSPFFPSPQYDSGYDISDYRGIDPIFGNMEDFEKLTSEAHKRGIKIILDFVGNHSSDEHPWFIESRSSKTNPKADWYYWRDAKPDGSPPNNWFSVFGGAAWTFDETRQQYYLHEFTYKQPDLNWRNPEVKEAMFDIFRFWVSKGVDGFRLDAIAMIMKNKDMPDEKIWDPEHPDFGHQEHNYDTNDPDIHPVLRELHLVLEEAGEDILTIGEVVVPAEDWAKYFGNPVDGKELDMPYYFDLMGVQWNADSLRSVIEKQERLTRGIGWPNYVLSNHDSPRIASKFGRENIRIAAMVLLMVRGTPTVYYGDELGMDDTEVPVERWTDPQAKKDHSNFCRDYCRTPMQWNISKDAGFSTVDDKTLWLPVADNYRQFNVEILEKNPRSILYLYRKLLWLRKKTPALHGGDYETLRLQPLNVYAFKRTSDTESYTVLINPTEDSQLVELGDISGRVVLATGLDREESVRGRVMVRAKEGLIIKNDK